MRSVQRDKRLALATFHDTYDLRRAKWQEHQSRVLEARERQTAQQQQREVMSSSVAEIMFASMPEREHSEVSHG